jgi:hypothetical protein
VIHIIKGFLVALTLALKLTAATKYIFNSNVSKAIKNISIDNPLPAG